MARKTMPAGRQSSAPAEAGNTSATVATVERAVDVLMCFVETSKPDLGVTEIADGLGLSKAAVHRVLSSLRARELIELDEDARRYSLGVGSMRLGLAYLERIDIRRIAHPELVALSRGTNETATLSVRKGRLRVYVDQVAPDREVIMSVGLAEPFPLHAGASSKAFLAFLKAEEIEEYLTDRPLDALTQDTVTDVKALRKELRAIHKQGWARSSGERKSGAASVAAPVLDHLGAPAAVVSVCGPQERFSDEFEACRDALLEATARLSAKLGWATPSVT